MEKNEVRIFITTSTDIHFHKWTTKIELIGLTNIFWAIFVKICKKVFNEMWEIPNQKNLKRETHFVSHDLINLTTSFLTTTVINHIISALTSLSFKFAPHWMSFLTISWLRWKTAKCRDVYIDTNSKMSHKIHGNLRFPNKRRYLPSIWQLK